MDKVEINGVDFTNKWSNSLPAAIDGKWYIYYKASYAWSHFEAPAAKGAEELSDSQSDSHVSIFPNPVNDVFTVESQDAIIELSLISSDGKTIYRNQPESNSIELGTENIPDGLYIVRIQTSNEMIIKRLIVD